MTKAIGGYVRRKDRVKGNIYRFPSHCFYCGVSFDEVAKGQPHPVNEPPHPRFVNVESLTFEQFYVNGD